MRSGKGVARRVGARLPRVPRVGGALSSGGRSTLLTELFAGIVLVALSLPLNIGYAETAGLPVIVGINAAILPPLVFALLSGSRHLVTGPDATIAALLAAALPSVAASSGAAPEELAIAVALMTGAILLALWLLRAGAMVRFISKSVLIGFLAGLGIEILTSQVEKIMNVSVDTGAWITDVWELVKSIPDASVASVVVGVSTIVIVRLMHRLAPALPGPLIALVLVGGTVAILEPNGVDLLGEIPSGLPSLSFPTVGLSTWIDLLGTSVAIAVLTVAEGLLVASSAARRHHDAFESNGELLSMGAANIAASVTSGMPIGASASRTAAVESAGSRSQLPALVSAVVVVVVALYLTDLVAEIPTAALAGLVANAVVSIIDVAAFRSFARMRRSELFIALGCTAGVLILGPTGGIVLALLATMVDMVRRVAASPAVTLKAPAAGWETGRFASAVTADDAGNPVQQPDGIEFIRLAGPLFFANADAIRTRAAAAAETDDRWVALDFESVTDVDPTAYEALTDAIAVLDEAGKTTVITRATGPIRDLLDRYGFATVLPRDQLFESNRAALAAYAAAQGSDA